MRWEALLWSLIAVGAPAAAGLLRRRIQPNVPDWAAPLVHGAGWLHGLLLPYLALILGSIPGGLVGLYAIRPLEWFTGGLACFFGLIAVLVVHQFRPVEALRYRSAVNRWKDEPRWALYRATGALWVNDLALGAGLGLVLSALEWMLSAWTRKPHALTEQDPEPLYRSAISTALFIVTHNFWLTAGTQLIFFLLLEHWAGTERELQTDAA